MPERPSLSRTLLFAIVQTAAMLGCGIDERVVPSGPRSDFGDFDTTYGNGSFGAWINDEFGLPAFRYDGCRTSDCKDPGDVFHQLGNGNVTAVAHSDGYVELFTAKTFYRFANHYDESGRNFAGGFGWVKDGGEIWSTLYTDRPATDPYERIFGMGYYEKVVAHGGLRVEDTVYAAPAPDEALLERVVLTNTSDAPKSVAYFDYWDVAWWLLRYDTVITRASTYEPAAVQTSYDEGRAALTAVSVAAAGDPDIPSLVRDPSPKTAFVAWLSGAPSRYDTVQSAFMGVGDRSMPDAVRNGSLTNSLDGSGTLPNQDAALVTEASFTLAPGERRAIDVLYGIAPRGTENDVIDRYRAGPSYRLPELAADWKKRVPNVDFPTEPWIRREMAWSAYYLLSGMLREDFFDSRVTNQGSFYQYVWGANAGPRSAMRHVLPLIYIDPDAAREVLVYYFRAMKENGELSYSTAGYGGWQEFGFSTSDSTLWLLAAIAEYVNVTRDYALLDETFDFYCDARRGACGSATGYEFLKRAYGYQVNVVGTGSHGLVRLMNSDWDDTLVAGGADAAQTHALGESTLNTALALVAYPKLAEIADRRNDPDFAAAVRAEVDGLTGPMQAQWRTDHVNRAYAYAADGTPIELGANNLWLASNAFALMSDRAVSSDQAAALVARMKSDLYDPSPLGLAAAGAPLTPGLGTAGFWYSLAGPAVEALGRSNAPGARDLAWSAFLRQTLAGHAETYPNVWYGTWSGPDMYYTPLDAPSPPSPGETWCFSKSLICMADFPVANMFSHGEPLLDSIRMAGVAAARDGFTMDYVAPRRGLTWESPYFSLRYTDRSAEGSITALGDDTVTLRVRPPSGLSPDGARAEVNGRSVTSRVDGAFVTFDLPVTARRAVGWSVAFQ